MPINIVCDECDKQLTVEDRFAGKRVRCPKCKGSIDVPEEELTPLDEEDPAPRKRGRAARDEEEERPRARRGSRDRDEDEEEERRPRKRAGEDEEEEEEPPAKKRKKKAKGGRSLLLWVGLGGGAALVLGLAVCGGLFFFLGGSVFGGLAEARYLPDGCEFISSERTAQIRKTRYSEAVQAKLGGLGGMKGSMHGIMPEEVERVTSGRAGSNTVTIITATRSITADEIKSGMSAGKGEFSEEKVGGYTLYVTKGFASIAFCIPESRILIIGSADTLRNVLQRGGKPQLTPDLQRAYSDASFSSSRVMVSSTSKDFKGGAFPGLGKVADAVLMQVDHGSTVYRKTKLYSKDSATAEDARKEAEEHRNKEPILKSESEKEAKKNASISRSGSVVTSTTHVREQTMIDDLNRR